MRLFAAVDPDPSARAAAARAAAALAARLPDDGPRRVRWTAPAQFHITLRFLGELSAAEVAAVRDVFRPPFETGGFAVRLSGPGCFPSAGPPRVLWMGIGEGREALAAVAAEIDGRLASAGRVPETRPFNGHLTLGRMKRWPARSRAEVVRVLSDVRPDTPRWTVERVVLCESRRTPRGAEYRVLESTPLARVTGTTRIAPGPAGNAASSQSSEDRVDDRSEVGGERP